MAVEVVRRAFLKEKYAQQTDHQKEAGRYPQHRVDNWQSARDCERQVLANEHEFNSQCGHQRKRRNVMEKGKKSRHKRSSRLPCKSLQEGCNPWYRQHGPVKAASE